MLALLVLPVCAGPEIEGRLVFEGAARYVAVYPAGPFAMTSWDAAPPSDQAENAHEVPLSTCGDGAEIEFLDPRMTVRVNGVTELPALNVIWSPDGFEPNERTTVCGWSVTLAVAVRPPESVAVRRSSR